jgi:hypothetical protein
MRVRILLLVQAGETVTVNIYPSLTDFTNTMLDGTKVRGVDSTAMRNR